MNDHLRKHLKSNYKVNNHTRGHLDNVEFIVEGNFFIELTKCTEYNCGSCDKVFDSPPIVYWRYNKSKKKWNGRCTCKKVFKS